MRQIFLLPLVAIAAPALAEEQPALPPVGETQEEVIETDEADANEIVVVASRLVGSVDAPQPPLVTLNEDDIAAYGASSVTELIEALGTQTTSSRGRGGGFPIMLINGQRISSFREMRNLPPEAIRRMEVLPEEVALRYGYAPIQRVVNIILKDNFASKTVEVEYQRPTDGGFDQLEAEASLFRIAGKSRLNLTVTANDTSPLTEGERGVQQNAPPVAGDPNPADYRTLVADTRDFGFNGTWTTPLGNGGAGLTLNAAASTTRSTSFSGLVSNTVGTAPDETIRYFPAPLVRHSKTDTYQAGLNFSKPLGQWRLTTTVDASTATTTTLIGQRPDLVPAVTPSGDLPLLTLDEDRARSRLDTINSLATLIGRPFTLPAGEASLTLKAGFNYTGITSNDTRTAVGEVKLDRKDLSAGINLGLPLTSRRDEVLGAVGDITLNLSAGIDHLSDFGTLFDYSAGITWGITDKLNLQASYIVNEAAPSLANLGNPQIVTDNVAVYDFTRGETAFVRLITGGNPNLVKEKQRDLKISANWQLPFLQRSSLQVEYIRNNSDDVTNGFPLLTPEIEAAFPGRVVRDADGRLLQIDQRPVTFDTITSSRIRYGFNLSGPLGKPQERAQEGGRGGSGRGQGAGRGDGPPPAGGAGRGGGGRGPGGPGGFGPGGRGGNGQGRWNLAVFHTYRFDETVLVAPGGPLLDLLNGDALSGGGVSRHSLEVEGGAFYRGLGLRFNGSWSAPTHVQSLTSDLRFGSKFDLDLRAFVNLGQQEGLVKAAPFFKNARLTIEVDNLFNARQRVTDANGSVPPAYAPDLIDPRGRMIGIQFRKQF